MIETRKNFGSQRSHLLFQKQGPVSIGAPLVQQPRLCRGKSIMNNS